jgi:hypothetical protein
MRSRILEASVLAVSMAAGCMPEQLNPRNLTPSVPATDELVNSFHADITSTIEPSADEVPEQVQLPAEPQVTTLEIVRDCVLCSQAFDLIYNNPNAERYARGKRVVFSNNDLRYTIAAYPDIIYGATARQELALDGSSDNTIEVLPGETYHPASLEIWVRRIGTHGQDTLTNFGVNLSDGSFNRAPEGIEDDILELFGSPEATAQGAMQAVIERYGQ